MRASLLLISLFLTLLLAGPGALAAVPKAVPAYQTQVLAEGLDNPWALVFLPDGRYLISEKSGQLQLLEQGKLTRLTGTPETYVKSQGGLQDLLLHPDYAQNGWIYLSYAWGDGQGNATRLARFQLQGNAVTNLQVLFTAEPLKKTPLHYGARMDFLPDKTLVLSVGDGSDYREQAQVPGSLLGKLVRLKDDGTVPADNPFVGQAGYHPAIYSLGHRNPQGMVYDPVRGLLFANEHGPRGGDEINIIRAGKNYGWPVITYGVDYSGAAITPFTEYPGMAQPLLNWTPSIAPSSLAVYNGALFPAFKGDLLSSALKAKEVRWVQMNGNQPVAEVSLFTELNARIRAVYAGPDGALYLLTDGRDGQLVRVVPAP